MSDTEDNILKQIPIQLLTGFLGSGKTTILNKIINDPRMKGTALIINEVGEIGIDQKLISTDNPVVLLDSGCICCSLQDGLQNVLLYLSELNAQGELNTSRVIIETTGIADPAPVINLLFNNLDIEYAYSFAGTITVLDGVNGKEELSKNYEAVKQIGMADRIILSKTDRISEEAKEELLATAHTLNPEAVLYTASNTETPFEAFLNYDVFDTPKDLSTVLKWINSKRGEIKLASNFAPTKITNLASKTFKTHSNYETVSLHYDKPLNRISVIRAFDLINQQFGTAILRMKGIFDFGEGYPFIIHGVCGECYPITNQAEWDTEKPFTEIVVIVSPKIIKQVEEMLKFNIRFLNEEDNESEVDII